jgi:hypothetical protein
MVDINRMAERHVLENESRLKYIDELVARVRQRAGELPEFAHVHTELDELVKERDRAAVQLDDMKHRAAHDWQEHEIQQSGLMGIWDAIAKQLERLVQRVDK